MLLTREGAILTHRDLFAASLREKVPFHVKLKDARFHFPEKKVTEKSRLADEPKFQHLEYNRLTQELISEVPLNTGMAQDIKAINKQLTLVLNLVLSTVATFYGIHYFAHSFSEVTKILLALFGALIVAVAELYFILRDLSREDTHLTKQNDLLNVKDTDKKKKVKNT